VSGEAQRWHGYRIARRVAESDNVVSLHLVSENGMPLPAFEAGQFLTFRLKDSNGKPAPRNYSISSDPAERTHLRISVKRELQPACRPELPPGFGSAFMHDHAAEGTVLEASAPKGQFRIDETSTRPVLLLAGGIGITPLLAMAHALSRQPHRPVWLVHASENGEVQPFSGEVRRLVERAPHIRCLTCLERPTPRDLADSRHAVAGRITEQVLTANLPIGNYDAYLCGPPGFMQAMFDLLVGLGVRESQIHYEFFGPVSKLVASAPQQAPADVVVQPADAPGQTQPSASAGDIVVTFAASGTSHVWDGSHRTLLDFAEAHGLSPAFSCRNGICNTCLCELDGKVRYVDEPLEEPGAGQVLLCCSVPEGSLRLGV
jgi:ferredoxin-NADP reductase